MGWCRCCFLISFLIASWPNSNFISPRATQTRCIWDVKMNQSMMLQKTFKSNQRCINILSGADSNKHKFLWRRKLSDLWWSMIKWIIWVLTVRIHFDEDTIRVVFVRTLLSIFVTWALLTCHYCGIICKNIIVSWRCRWSTDMILRMESWCHFLGLWLVMFLINQVLIVWNYRWFQHSKWLTYNNPDQPIIILF